MGQTLSLYIIHRTNELHELNMTSILNIISDLIVIKM